MKAIRWDKLAIGYWLLAIGYWLLAIGYWLLAIGYASSSMTLLRKYALATHFPSKKLCGAQLVR
ncbi:hypothetical protein CJ184_003320 [Actinotignum urinale]|uniref:hypothetical protein n=1 Tax=Actinotignum urinale TaxID=190146 RepID=UPI0011AECBFD|nr:hypothetical protein [Actinotignum urinale]WIK59681.1 hypothetical protein CJ184_003320 [Actinotignum urinale]